MELHAEDLLESVWALERHCWRLDQARFSVEGRL
jgi:hypothetical protein